MGDGFQNWPDTVPHHGAVVCVSGVSTRRATDLAFQGSSPLIFAYRFSRRQRRSHVAQPPGALPPSRSPGRPADLPQPGSAPVADDVCSHVSPRAELFAPATLPARAPRGPGHRDVWDESSRVALVTGRPGRQARLRFDVADQFFEPEEGPLPIGGGLRRDRLHFK